MVIGQVVQVTPLVTSPGETWVDCVEILEFWVLLRSFWLFVWAVIVQM